MTQTQTKATKPTESDAALQARIAALQERDSRLGHLQEVKPTITQVVDGEPGWTYYVTFPRTTQGEIVHLQREGYEVAPATDKAHVLGTKPGDVTIWRVPAEYRVARRAARAAKLAEQRRNAALARRR